MVKLSSKMLVVVAGALALSSTAGLGVASADPLIDSTCTYSQVISALNAENPELGKKLAGNPVAIGMLSSFISMGPAERAQFIQKYQDTAWGQKYFGPISAIAGSCSNY